MLEYVMETDRFITSWTLDLRELFGVLDDEIKNGTKDSGKRFVEAVTKEPIPYLVEACQVNKSIRNNWIDLGEGGYYDPGSRNLMLIRGGRMTVYPENDRRKNIDRVPVLII